MCSRSVKNDSPSHPKANIHSSQTKEGLLEFGCNLHTILVIYVHVILTIILYVPLISSQLERVYGSEHRGRQKGRGTRTTIAFATVWRSTQQRKVCLSFFRLTCDRPFPMIGILSSHHRTIPTQLNSFVGQRECCVSFFVSLFSSRNKGGISETRRTTREPRRVTPQRNFYFCVGKLVRKGGSLALTPVDIQHSAHACIAA